MITHEEAHELFAYDTHTGRVTNKKRRGTKAKKGKEAGYQHTTLGYRYICIGGKMYLAHRLIWFMLHDEWPEEIDHINGVRFDNRLSNLRVATSRQNKQNRRTQSNNTSGYCGVHWYKQTKKWQAYIDIDGKRKHLGYFKVLEEAARAYNEAALKHFGEFAKLNII